MLGEGKLIVPPLFAAAIVIANVINSLPDGIRLVLDLSALAVLFAGFLVLGRLRAQVTASEGAAKAWREERDALSATLEREREELRVELSRKDAEILAFQSHVSELRVEVTRLEARPTLESLEDEIRKLASLMAHMPQASVPVEP